MSDPETVPNDRYPTLDGNEEPVVMEPSAYPTFDNP